MRRLVISESDAQSPRPDRHNQRREQQHEEKRYSDSGEGLCLILQSGVDTEALELAGLVWRTGLASCSHGCMIPKHRVVTKEGMDGICLVRVGRIGVFSPSVAGQKAG